MASGTTAANLCLHFHERKILNLFKGEQWAMHYLRYFSVYRQQQRATLRAESLPNLGILSRITIHGSVYSAGHIRAFTAYYNINASPITWAGDTSILRMSTVVISHSIMTTLLQ